jgi:hypothetical protein
MCVGHALLKWYNKPGASGTRVHAKCNSVLHLARRRVLHSAGGPYITCIPKQMDEGFAGTQLYRQRVFFFLTPQSVNFGPAQPV